MTEDDDLPELQDGEPADEATTVDAASPRVHRKRETAAKIRKREADGFWRAVLSDPIGRREMWGLLTEGGAFEDKFACGPNGFPQPEASWFHAGAKSFVQRLYHTWIGIDPESVIAMHKEWDSRFAVQAVPKAKRET